MKRSARLAVLPAATLVFGGLFTLAAAPAAHACYGGTPFVGATAGTQTSSSSWWTTQSVGSTTLQLVASDPNMHLHVYRSDCSYVSSCDQEQTCTVSNYTGTLSIEVHTGSGEYTLLAVPSGAPSVEPPPTGTCNLVDTLGVCVNVTTEDVIQRVTVRNVALGEGPDHTVVGAIDRYRFPLPTGGSIVLPCIVLTANGLGSDDCEAAGATFVDRVATLVDEDVNQPTVGFGTPLASVGVCEARLTVTVAGFGLEEFPAAYLC